MLEDSLSMQYAQDSLKHNAYGRPMQVAYALPMAKKQPTEGKPQGKQTYRGPRFTRRKDRLRILVAKFAGGRSELIARLETTADSHLSAMLSPKSARGVGDHLADRIEDIAGYPNGWLDQLDSSKVEPLDLKQTLARLAYFVQSGDDDFRRSVASSLTNLVHDPQGHAAFAESIERALARLREKQMV